MATLTRSILGVGKAALSQAAALIQTMRPKQWTKNGFIFVPLIFDGKLPLPINDRLSNTPYFLLTAAGFALLCLSSSAIYVINDLVDIEADRAHPIKRDRPLPSGRLSRGVAIAAAIALPAVSLLLAFLLDGAFAAVLAGYLALQIAYSFWLKHIALLDVLTIAAGFLLRVAAGVVLVDVQRFSPWLYIFTAMLALFLGFAKRRQELVLLQEGANNHRAIFDHYNVKLLDEIILITTATTVMTYALYTFSAEGLPENHAMMLTTPFVLYGIFRYLYLIHVRGEGDAPDEVILRDRPMQAAVLLWGLAVILILYVLA